MPDHDPHRHDRAPEHTPSPRDPKRPEDEATEAPTRSEPAPLSTSPAPRKYYEF